MIMMWPKEKCRSQWVSHSPLRRSLRVLPIPSAVCVVPFFLWCSFAFTIIFGFTTNYFISFTFIHISAMLHLVCCITHTLTHDRGVCMQSERMRSNVYRQRALIVLASSQVSMPMYLFVRACISGRASIQPACRPIRKYSFFFIFIFIIFRSVCVSVCVQSIYRLFVSILYAIFKGICVITVCSIV